MLDGYKVNRCTRQCYSLQRPLREGEWYYSVVLPCDDDFERRDYSAEAWDGPPEDAIGWWKNRMPTADQQKLVLAPKAVLLDLLRQMSDFPERAKSRYLLALMLMRKKIVKESTDSECSSDEETLRVEVLDDGSLIEVPVCSISHSESDQLRDELNELLYCEADQFN